MRDTYRNGDPISLNNCDGCNPSMINGVLCHETGCPDAWKDKSFECRECGCDFYASNRHQSICEDCSNPDNEDMIESSDSYELVVGNVGTFLYDNEETALKEFDEWVEQSKNADVSRVYGEDVTLIFENDIIKEYIGHLRAELDE